MLEARRREEARSHDRHEEVEINVSAQARLRAQSLVSKSLSNGHSPEQIEVPPLSLLRALPLVLYLLVQITIMSSSSSDNNFSFAGRMVGPDHPPLVIAEIGINHEGDMPKAKQMILDAKNAGCEVCKFQSHVIEDEMIPEAKKVVPGNTNVSIWEVMERCALSEEAELELKNYVEELGMIFLSTPFSRAAAIKWSRTWGAVAKSPPRTSATRLF